MRPMNKLEKDEGGKECINYDDKKIVCKVNKKNDALNNNNNKERHR